MTSYVIDIRARHVTSEHRIWRLFPGEHYRFLDLFLKHGVVFLDFPGLALPDGPIAKTTLQLRERVLMARAIAAWAEAYRRHLRLRREGPPPSEPSREPASYANSRHRPYSNDLGAIIGLFGEAKKGDLVVVPDKLSTRRIHIGELLDEPAGRTRLPIERYNEEPVWVRRVQWFPAVDELRVSSELSDVLRRPNPFSQLGRQFRLEVYDESYGTYHDIDTFAAKFTTESEHFTSNDAFDISLLTKLFSAISQDVENAEPVEPYTDISELVLFRQIHPDYQVDVAYSISSPGTILLKSSTIVPIFAAAMFALMSAANAADPPGASDVGVVNSANPDDPCLPAINENIRETLALMGYNVWEEACRRAKDLKDRPRVQSGARTQSR